MSDKNRTGLGILVLGLFILAITTFLPKYKPRKLDLKQMQIDSLKTEIEIRDDNRIRMQMKLRYYEKI